MINSNNTWVDKFTPSGGVLLTPKTAWQLNEVRSDDRCEWFSFCFDSNCVCVNRYDLTFWYLSIALLGWLRGVANRKKRLIWANKEEELRIQFVKLCDLSAGWFFECRKFKLFPRSIPPSHCRRDLQTHWLLSSTHSTHEITFAAASERKWKHFLHSFFFLKTHQSWSAWILSGAMS